MRPRLPRTFTTKHDCIRIMQATAEVVSKRGVDGAKIGDLVRSARCSRKTFYGCFDGKQDCLEQTLLWIGERARRQMAEASDGADHRSTVEARLEALLRFVNDHPSRLRFT